MADVETSPDQAIEEMFDTPEASEGEAEAAPAPEEPAAPPSETPRDEQGRFTRRSKAESEPDGAVTEEPAEADPGAEPTEETPPTEEPTEPTEPEAEEAPDQQAPTFAYRADGHDYEIPGSAVGQDGIFIPTNEVPHVQRLLASGRAFPRFQQQLQSEAHQARQESQTTRTQLETLVGAIEQRIENGTLDQWLGNIREEWPILKAQAEAAALKQQTEADRRELQRLQQTEEDQRDAPLLRQSVAETIVQLAPEFGFSTQEPTAVQALEAIYRQLAADDMQLRQMFPRATQDDPAQNVRVGQRLDNRAAVVRQHLQMLRQVWGLKPTPQPPKKAEQAKAANAKVLTEGKKPPSTVPATRGPSPRQSGKMPEFKSTREVDDFLWGDDGFKDL